jgi:Sulfotransferase domain
MATFHYGMSAINNMTKKSIGWILGRSQGPEGDLRGTNDPNASCEDISLDKTLREQWIYPTTHTEDGDVFIASYPKSGVTWLRHMTISLLYGMDASKTPNIIVNTIFPDLHKLKYYLRTGKPAIFKTHDLPRPEMKKVVHLVRDGRDVMSSYHAMLDNEGHDIPMERMISHAEGMYPCDWSRHCEEWLKNPYQAEILRISYEDLINRTEQTLSRYCEFVGIEADADLIRETIQNSTFSKMQKKELEQGWGPLHKPLKKGMFVRKGKIGSYLDDMSKENIMEFERQNSVVLEKLGYKTETTPDSGNP